MKLADVVTVLEDLVPLHLAESWDNVGLLLGDPAQDVSRALFCVDMTGDVLDEARREGCGLVVAYHPPVFEGLRRVTAGSLAFDALRAGIACWSPHSALDVAPGGTSDVLASALGLVGARPLRRSAAAARACKLVTFVPEGSADAVASALFEAGAGVIGQYQSCSFRTPGTGTFFGNEGTNPAAGEPLRLESVAELRLETVAPLARLPEIVAALRRSHPYEEPAFDLVTLQAEPESRGLGREGELGDPAERREVLERVKRALELKALLVAGPRDGIVTRAACGPGSCGDLWKDALARGAGVYLTGELKHHQALAAARSGLTVACTLHSNSERAALPRLAGRVSELCPALQVRVSETDADPFAFA